MADSNDRTAWLAARRTGVTATDVARIASGKRNEVMREKLSTTESSFDNKYMKWGRDREAFIAAILEERTGVSHNVVLFRSEANARHLATPDGVGTVDGQVVYTSEIKTSKHNLHPDSDAFKKSGYYDQIQWAMYVIGATSCAFAWEQHHDDWNPDPTPYPLEVVWIQRDQLRIVELVLMADQFLYELDNFDQGEADGLEDLVHAIIEAQKGADEASKVVDILKDALREQIGDVTDFTAETKYGRVTLSTPKPTERFDSKSFKEANPALYSEFITVSEPARPTLRITAAKVADDVL
jgi:hypothetical protein